MSASSSAKTLSPPPAYSEFAESAQHQPYIPSRDATNVVLSASSGSQSHAGYGPTPIAQYTHLLPYYDLRSPYALAEAGSRARWRFVGAMVWAVAILLLAGFVTGYEVHLKIHHALLGGQSTSGDTDIWQAL
ncbi:hypothetical protein BKA93DRAFT_770946 [Sparassis latifolia]|uniref:Uncharacterized protein n=1 Tax=Sparassis crispa TaxID=139825 RepID=A0A401GD57_9APHY|nr:hypothetical protein SCP_0213190 [Sparassis crispa]GBE80116.1 hypothetical protein SCP_0213190 [Sparassis crispa]